MSEAVLDRRELIDDPALDGRDAFDPIVLRLLPAVKLSEDQFFEICQINRDIRIERDAEGDLILMPPTGGETGDRNSEINMQLRMWAKKDGTGRAFDSSTGFILPNKSVRAPDGAWVTNSRLAALTPDERQKFIPLCPDFVIELRSPTDRMANVRRKMAEYMENGARLGWLIDPPTRTVFVYRPGQEIEELKGARSIFAPDLLPGFEFNLLEIW